jgi:outer membrane protein OmpA-like peptidoglycan-associated protein
LFEILGRVAGLGGIAVGVLLLIFRDVVRKNVFPKFTKAQAYRTLNLIVILTFVTAALGLGAWVYVIENPTGVEQHSNPENDPLAKLNQTLRPIYFDRAKPGELPGEAVAVIHNDAMLLKDAKVARIIVEGHVDEVSPKANFPDATRMAETVAHYLAEDGIAQSSIKVVSLGAEQSIKPGHSLYNNRVQIIAVELQH